MTLTRALLVSPTFLFKFPKAMHVSFMSEQVILLTGNNIRQKEQRRGRIWRNATSLLACKVDKELNKSRN